MTTRKRWRGQVHLLRINSELKGSGMKNLRIEFRKQGVLSSTLRSSGRPITSQGEKGCDRTKRQSTKETSKR